MPSSGQSGPRGHGHNHPAGQHGIRYAGGIAEGPAGRGRTCSWGWGWRSAFVRTRGFGNTTTRVCAPSGRGRPWAGRPRSCTRGADRIYLFNFQDSRSAGRAMDGVPEGHRIPPARWKPPLRNLDDISSPSPTSTPPANPRAPSSRPGATRENRRLSNPHRRPRHGPARVFVGLHRTENANLADLDVRVNGTPCPPEMPSGPRPVHPIVKKSGEFGIPGRILHDGFNVVEVTGRSDAGHEMVWMGDHYPALVSPFTVQVSLRRDMFQRSHERWNVSTSAVDYFPVRHGSAPRTAPNHSDILETWLFT